MRFKCWHVKRSGVAPCDCDVEFRCFRRKSELNCFVSSGSAQEFEKLTDVYTNLLRLVGLVFVKDGFRPLEVDHGDPAGIHSA